MNDIVPVILCGGSGTRLWPRSRAAKPKPFLPLVGDSTLFEASLRRCPADAGFAQLGDAAAGAIIIEPEAKNTAAAIALAACRLPEDAVMLVCPSDHHIGDTGAFFETARAAASLAREGWLVSFGIEANFPETGFGYLKRGEPIGELGYRTAQFVEKPDLDRAKAFVAGGLHAWNGGIFAFRVGDFLEELAVHRPDLAAAVRQSVEQGRADRHRFHPEPRTFAEIKAESVDYAVMENTARAAMVPADIDWSDIGNWQALHQARQSDADGNCIAGDAELVDCRNVLVDTDGPKVSVIGLEDVIVVVDGDDVMITTAQGVQKVGKLDGAANQ
jgi:mannose-1-phosphate guanylyltransferase/mannose-1-phosphate guanylyltransferase/mannose-6-phosphate isomerase